MRLLLPAALCTVAIVTGCASSGAGTSGATPSRRGDLITRQELLDAGVTNVYDGIQRLRSAWLRTRGTSTGGTSIPIYIDGIPSGDTERLRTMAVERVEDIRRISASDATTRWGTGHQNGAIEVRTRR